MTSFYAPDDTPVDSGTIVYKTPNTNFVAAALAADLMTYINAELDPLGRVVFLLEDVGNRGASLERTYSRRVFTRVSPILFVEARNFLQSEVVRIKGTTETRHEQTK